MVGYETRLRTMLRHVDKDLADLRTKAANVQERISQCETLRATLIAGLGEEGSATPAALGRKPKGPRPAAGTIPGRVLDIVGELDDAVSMADILAAKHGAKEKDVISAVRTLVRTGYLVASGMMRERRYSLPVKSVKTKGGAK